MSIIEKALDKSDDKGARAPKPARPRKPLVEHDTSVADGQRKARPSDRAGAPSKQAPLLEPTDVYPASPEAERSATPRNRPDFPRQTTKRIAIDLARLDAAGIVTPESGRRGRWRPRQDSNLWLSGIRNPQLYPAELRGLPYASSRKW